MGELIRRRLVQLVVVVFIVTAATFVMLEAIPGDPCLQRQGPTATQASLEACHDELNLDEPLPTRYLGWLGSLAQGDLGESYSNGIPVSTTLAQTAPVTAQLMVYSMVLSLLVAIPLGVFTAEREGSFADRFATGGAYALLSIPTFVVGIVLVLVFSVHWKLFPSSDVVPFTENPVQHLRSMVLPTITLAASDIAIYLRMLRTELATTLSEDFIMTARAKGVSQRTVMWRHALRPSSIGVLTFAGLSIGRLIAGAVVVERIFGINGVGNYLVNSVLQRDYLVLQTLVALIAVSFVLTNLAVDLLYVKVDPRMRPGVRA